MKALVTGSSGFLGAHLCAHLEAQGVALMKLTSRLADLRVATSLAPWSGERYDLIFHLAAWTQAGDFCLYHPGEQWIINQEINTTVLRWWAEHQPQAKLVSMGTSCAYAPGSNLVEDEYMAGEPIDSLYTYAMTKRMLYQGQRALNRQYGLCYLTAVPSTLYGAGYHTDGRQMHFIFDLIRKILRAKEFGETVTLWGDGHQKRELVLVDDFVGILWRLVQGVDNDLVNIGAGEEHSIRSFAERICAIIDYPVDEIRYDVSRYTGARSKCLSVAKARALVPDYTLTSLEVGLRRTIDWFLETGVHRHQSAPAA